MYSLRGFLYLFFVSFFFLPFFVVLLRLLICLFILYFILCRVFLSQEKNSLQTSFAIYEIFELALDSEGEEGDGLAIERRTARREIGEHGETSTRFYVVNVYVSHVYAFFISFR